MRNIEPAAMGSPVEPFTQPGDERDHDQTMIASLATSTASGSFGCQMPRQAAEQQ
jgi:hypothetical protein